MKNVLKWSFALIALLATAVPSAKAEILTVDVDLSGWAVAGGWNTVGNGSAEVELAAGYKFLGAEWIDVVATSKEWPISNLVISINDTINYTNGYWDVIPFPNASAGIYGPSSGTFDGDATTIGGGPGYLLSTGVIYIETYSAGESTAFGNLGIVSGTLRITYDTDPPPPPPPTLEQLPDLTNGGGFYSDAEAGYYYSQKMLDDFPIESPTTINGVGWWGGSEYYTHPDLTNMSGFLVEIYSDAGGLPGELVVSETFSVPATNPEVVGINFGGADIYYHNVNFATPVELSAGGYWVSVSAYLIVGGDDAYVWTSAATTTDDLIAADFFDGNGFWAGTGYGDLSFRILVDETSGAEVVGSAVYHGDFTGLGSPIDTRAELAKEGDATTLSLANLVNSSAGLNGVAFDIEGLGNAGALSASDFEIQWSPQGAYDVGSNPPNAWAAVSTAPSVSVTGGSPAQVLLQWPTGTIQNRWLRVTIKATENTGLVEPEVYYVGHVIGEVTGADGATYTVSFSDLAEIRAATGIQVDAGNLYDIDKNGTVSFADISAARDGVGTQLSNITIP